MYLDSAVQSALQSDLQRVTGKKPASMGAEKRRASTRHKQEQATQYTTTQVSRGDRPADNRPATVPTCCPLQNAAGRSQAPTTGASIHSHAARSAYAEVTSGDILCPVCPHVHAGRLSHPRPVPRLHNVMSPTCLRTSWCRLLRLCPLLRGDSCSHGRSAVHYGSQGRIRLRMAVAPSLASRSSRGCPGKSVSHYAAGMLGFGDAWMKPATPLVPTTLQFPSRPASIFSLVDRSGAVYPCAQEPIF
jgi:hypothetical protein